jgi:serine/threonine protein kinase
MTTAQKPPDPYIGRSLHDGAYVIEQKIGSGGMGSVYRASEPAANRRVAIKILHAKLAARKDLVSRFRREAMAMSHLSHPNTVRVLTYGELEDGSLFIVMEHLEGRNLNQVVRREGPLPVDRAVHVLVQACGALQEAHAYGIVHRDLKPENIFICPSHVPGQREIAKVLDFGLAKVTERELRPGSVMLTQEGMVFGTPEFMSPEQAQGKTLDARSDIYSLAAILYEVITGKLPFDAKTPMEHIQLHVTRAPIPLDERVPNKKFPPGLGAVIAKALEKKPDQRYASAADFARALQPFGPPGTELVIVEPKTDTKEYIPISYRGGVPNLAAVASKGVAKTLNMDGGTPPPPTATPASSKPLDASKTGDPAKLAAPGQTSIPAPPPKAARRRGMRPSTIAILAIACIALGAALTLALLQVAGD